MPKVSFIIRTKNEQKWIRKVLESLFRQSEQNFEVIIVDSGSTDETLKIVKDFPVKLIQIKEEDFNYSYALNLGLRQAGGKIIGILSGHSVPVSDFWLENGLIFFKDGKVAGVTGFVEALPDGSFYEKVSDFLIKPIKKIWRSDYCRAMTNSNSLIRKSLWEDYSFDENLDGAEDYDWACEMIFRGYNIVRDPKFNVKHSHGGLKRKTSWDNRKLWRKMRVVVDQKERKHKNAGNI